MYKFIVRNFRSNVADGLHFYDKDTSYANIMRHLNELMLDPKLYCVTTCIPTYFPRLLRGKLTFHDADTKKLICQVTWERCSEVA